MIVVLDEISCYCIRLEDLIIDNMRGWRLITTEDI